MLVNQQVLDLAFKGFKTVVTDAMLEAKAYADQVAMTVPSASRDETYGWLGSFPAMREWLGPRNVKNLVANGFTIQNRKFESTLEIARDDISDDRLGIFKPMFAEMGQAARRHPEELVFSLMASGFTTNCYDGQFFFDTDHPVTDADGAVTQVSNFQGARAPPGICWTHRGRCGRSSGKNARNTNSSSSRKRTRNTSSSMTATSTASGRG